MGPSGLDRMLAMTDMLVVLLPLTEATRGMIDASLLGKLRQGGRLGGPILINAGRGGLQVEADILAALDSGLLKGASLDVFEREPLPEDSRLWTHPGVYVSPHNASVSTPEAIAAFVARQIEAHERGEPLTQCRRPAARVLRRRRGAKSSSRLTPGCNRRDLLLCSLGRFRSKARSAVSRLPNRGFAQLRIKVVVHDAEEGGFWAEVPAIPGCATQGDTMEELLRNLREAIEGCLSVDVAEPKADNAARVLEIACMRSLSGRDWVDS